MNNYKPYAYLYKRKRDPAKLKSCFIAQIPAGKKLTLRSGDPTIQLDQTLIRYNIENDASSMSTRMEEFENEFSWDGNANNVIVTIGDGSGSGGGKTTTSTENAEIY